MASTDADIRNVRAPAAVALQAALFAAPNQFTASGVTGDAAAQSAFTQSLRRHAQGYTDRPLLLAFNDGTGMPTAWFACAPSEAMGRALHSELNAFLGPSFVNLLPLDRAADSADNHALALIAAENWHAIRFDAPNQRVDEMVLRQWRVYWNLLERRPRAASYVPKTFDQLRAAFDLALAARNEAGALAAMSSLRERFGISAENREYLAIRLAAAFERWEVIANHPLLPHILHQTLPPETYGDVIEALYRANVQPFEQAKRIEELLEQFVEMLAEPARPLFRSRRTSRRPAVLKAFLLHELVQPQPQAAVCDALLHDLPGGAFGNLDAALRAHVKTLSRTVEILPARQAMEAEQFDRAWDLFWLLPDDEEVLRGLIACAREIDDPAKVNAVLSRLEAAAASIRQSVETASAGRLAKLRAAMLTQPATTPATYAAQLTRYEGESTEHYIERWRELARSIDPNKLLTEEGLAQAAVECLTYQALEEPDTFERLYPLWHELFVERIEPDRRLSSVYMALQETLRVRDVFTESEQELLHQALVAIVQVGDESEYRRSVDEVHLVFERIRAPQCIGWALDVCDSLAMLRTRDADARMRLLASVIQACTEFRERLTSLQRQLLSLLAREAHIDLPDVGTGSDTAAQIPQIAGPSLRVVFYSLNEAATRRAVDLLRTLHPHWHLDTNADLVCTPKLKSLAQTAQIFVFAWKSSKHAAYDCVKAAISVKNNLVMARGVGTTSLVTAALERVGAPSGEGD